MADYNCEACEEIRQKDASLIVNGFSDTECNYLKNNTGIDGASDDCTDLDLLNDCLVGNMESEVDSYDVCDWRDFMKAFIGNVWTVFKAIICAICGIYSRVEQLECVTGYLGSGAKFEIGEEATDGSYVVAGKGVSFYEINASGTGFSSDIGLTYIAGGLFVGNGSLILHTTQFTDSKACVNFDNGSVERTSTSRKGNSNFSNSGRYANDGELLYEIRIDKTEYPELKRFFNGFGIETGSGSYTVRSIVFTQGEYAFGNHGGCNKTTGAANQSDYDDGHLVPNNFVYIQVRLSHTDYSFSDGAKRSPHYYMGGRIDQGEIPC